MEEKKITRDIIRVTIGRDHTFNCDTVVIGRTGEHIISRFEIDLPAELCTMWPYLDFKKPNGEKVITKRLEIADGKIGYDIPNGLLDKNGTLEAQLLLKTENGETWKSASKKFVVLESIDASDEIPAKEDFITDAQNLLDELTEAKENGEFNGKDGVPDYSLVASAIKCNVSGNPVAFSDVSPLVHEIKVKLIADGGKNLFHFPKNETVSGYYDLEGTEYEENEKNTQWSYTTEGSKIKISDPIGDLSASYGIDLSFNILELLGNVDRNKKLTISAITNDEYFNGEVMFEGSDISYEPLTFTLSNLDAGYLTIMCWGWNGDICIQVEEGETATAYEDYGAGVDVNGATVQKFFGKNYAPVESHTWTGSWTKLNPTEPLKVGKKYYFIADVTTTSADDCVTVYDATNGNYSTWNAGENSLYEFTPKANAGKEPKDCVLLWIHAQNGYVANSTNVATLNRFVIVEEQEPIPYTADEEGNISIVGNGESMTLIAEDGVTISAEYNADTKKYIDRRFAELATALATAQTGV